MKRIIKRVLVSVLVISLVGTGAVGLLVYNRIFGTIGRIDHDGIVTIAPENEDFDVTASVDGTTTQTTSADVGIAGKIENYFLPTVEPINHEHLINILIVGQDKKEGDTTRQRSDIMMLCSYNMQRNEVSVISFLRDMYVKIPGGYSNNKLNAAYHFGGFPLLYQTLLDNFGIKVDGGVEVDFDGFVDIVDMLGGVDVYLTAKEAPYVSSTATEGVNHLNGRKALNYARTRKTDDDFGRTERQRKLLLLLFDKVKDADSETIKSLIDRALTMVKTDMTDSSITSLVAALLPKISTLKINTYHVPMKGSFTYGYARGMQVLIPDLQEIRDTLESEYLPM
ncbi:MAG: LCP family protein [Clostridia bacterium]|nr:LCP family protein [Clostridia bacterium]